SPTALLVPCPLTSTRFPYTTLFRSPVALRGVRHRRGGGGRQAPAAGSGQPPADRTWRGAWDPQHRPHRAEDAELLYAAGLHPRRDRKSTRLNSSHVKISYAVFCLKK